MFSKNIKINKGFTLIELMVAMSIFTMVMVIGMGSLVVTSNAAKNSRGLRTAADNINFAMESMTREFRMGTDYNCQTSSDITLSEDLGTQDCPISSFTPGYLIAFKPQQVTGAPVRVAYKKKDRGNGTSSLVKYELKNGVLSEADVVSSNVDIKTLYFYVNGSSINDNIQPSIQILVKGSVRVKNVDIPFILQSMVSQRSAE